MDLTYSKYGINYAFLDDPESRADYPSDVVYIPDAFFDALIGEVLPAFESGRLAERVAPHLHMVEGRKNRIIIPGPSFTWEESKKNVTAMLETLDPEIASLLETLTANGWIDLSAATAPGLCEGVCDPTDRRSDGRPSTIRFTYDGTINDPVYLSHELGHFANDAASPGFDWESASLNRTAACLRETQAFFLQHAFYDSDCVPALQGALRQHCQAEAFQCLGNLRQDLAVLEKTRALSDEERHSHEGFEQQEDAFRRLHNNVHRPAFFIAAGLYERFRKMETTQKKNFLDLLYRSGNGGPAMENVLRAAHIKDYQDFRKMVREGLDRVLQPSAAGMTISRASPPAFSI